MRENRPNIILIMTDQQRFDTIRAFGADYMITPNLDRLAREGMTFTNAFATAPSCVPSRASFFNCRYPISMGVHHNFSNWKSSWVELLNERGYHTVNVGKMHTVPYDVPCGFDERYIIENKDRPIHYDAPHGDYLDEWDRYLLHSRISKPTREWYRSSYPGYHQALGAYEWPLEEALHPDVFVGRAAVDVVKRRESQNPFFLQIGFPGPHPPYDPPARFLDLYADRTFPAHRFSEEEARGQVPPHKVFREIMINGNHDAVRWQERPSADQLGRLWKHYAANVTLIDDQIGSILEALQLKGYLDNAVVIFMSDHGDALGDHGLIQKWSMYDCVVRVPMIMWWPNRVAAGSRNTSLVQHMDVPYTLLEAIGINGLGEASHAQNLGADFQGGRDAVFAEHAQDEMYRDEKLVSMIRTDGFKLVHYLDRPYGELYSLHDDPREERNLWSNSECRSVRAEMMDRLVSWRFGSILSRGTGVR